MAKKYLQLASILKKLLFKNNMRPTELSKETKVSDANIHRILTGESKNPYKTTTEPIANFFGISVEQLLGVEPLPSDLYLGEDSCTKILPLLSWSSLDKRSQITSTSKEVAVMNVSENGFAVVNPDSSMEPLFQKGSILIFDPNRAPQDRSFVLIKLSNPKCYVFRQVVFDLNQKHMKALNPDIGVSSLRKINIEDVIIATLIEDRRNHE